MVTSAIAKRRAATEAAPVGDVFAEEQLIADAVKRAKAAFDSGDAEERAAVARLEKAANANAALKARHEALRQIGRGVDQAELAAADAEEKAARAALDALPSRATRKAALDAVLGELDSVDSMAREEFERIARPVREKALADAREAVQRLHDALTVIEMTKLGRNAYASLELETPWDLPRNRSVMRLSRETEKLVAPLRDRRQFLKEVERLIEASSLN